LWLRHGRSPRCIVGRCLVIFFLFDLLVDLFFLVGLFVLCSLFLSLLFSFFFGGECCRTVALLLHS